MTEPSGAVEAVAKAIYDASHSGFSNCYAWTDRWEDHQEARRDRYYKEARAAIAIMLTPSDKEERISELEEALKGMIRCHAASLQNWQQALADAQASGNGTLAVDIQNTALVALSAFPVDAAKAALSPERIPK